MDFLGHSRVGITFILFSASVASVSVTLPTLEGDLPTITIEERIFLRAKRDRPGFSAGLGPNNYKEGPDFIPGILPSPGAGLDERILESNDGRYHGLSLKYRGATADIMATTMAYDKQHFAPPPRKNMSMAMSESMSKDDLRTLQALFNRWRLQQASVTRPPITTPIIAWIQDPNYNLVKYDERLFPGARRMMESGYDMPKAYIPALKMYKLDPRRIIKPPVVEPFVYNPLILKHVKSTTATRVTPELSLLSPLEVFKRLYINTTKQRIRTRKPRPKTTVRIQPMKDDDDEFIPEDSYMDSTTSIIQTYRPDATEADEDGIIPNIPRFRNEDAATEADEDRIIPNVPTFRNEDAATKADENRIIPNVPTFRNEDAATEADEDRIIPNIPPFRNEDAATEADEDIIIPNIPRFRNEDEGPELTGYEKPKPKTVNAETYDMNDKPMGGKQFIDHIKSLEPPMNKEPDNPYNNIRRLHLNVHNQKPGLKEIVGKIKKVELPGDEEFEKSEFNKQIHENSKIKNLNKELLEDLVLPETTKEIPQLAKQGLKVDLPGMGKSDSEDPPGKSFNKLMQVPQLERKSGHADRDEQMNEQLYKLLIPDEEA